MTLANEDTSGRLSTNKDIANKPRRIIRAQQSTHEMWEANHEECIKMTSRTKHHNSIVYEKAPRLRYTLNSQASIGFVDNL